MITLRNTKTLRYSMEEIYRMERPKNLPFGTDWFGMRVERENPGWYIECVLRDDATEYVYVILTRKPVVVEQRVVRKGRFVKIVEKLIDV